MSYASLGTVRLSPVVTRHTVATGGETITSHINEPLAARVREARAERDRNEDLMHGTARVQVASLTDWLRAGGTRTW